MGEKKGKAKFVVPYRHMFIAFFVISFFSVLFCFWYYSRLDSTIQAESKDYLQEVNGQIGANVSRIIKDNYAVLYTMASTFQTMDGEPVSEIQSALKRQQQYWDYEDVMLVDESGNAYDVDNNEVFVQMDPQMRQNIVEGRQSMSTTQILANKEYILFSVPLKGVKVREKDIVALVATYDPNDFEQALSMTSFDGQAYSQIVTKSGTVITRSSSKYAMRTGYNIFSSLSRADIDKGNSIEQATKEIDGGKSNQIGFTMEGVHRYMVYMPIQPGDWYLLTFVPGKAINERSDTLLKSTILMFGVLSATYVVLILLLLYVFNNSRRRLEQMAYFDVVTGGNTAQRFYELARRQLTSVHKEEHALVYSNIEKFKVMNEQIGRQNCDLLLFHFYAYVNSKLSDKECMGRISADNFGILLSYQGEKELLERFRQWIEEAGNYIADQMVNITLPSMEFGIYVIEDETLLFSQMIDRAKLALKEAPLAISSKLKYAFYNDEVRRQLFREKQLEDMMDEAVESKEFQVYLQPKYGLLDEQVGGAEALVRWKSKSEGMILPNDFIPLFEKNGFIVRLDIYVFEEVCRTIQRWRKQGIEPVKISVNCSRVHFGTPDFLVPYITLADKYGIQKGDIEIELTESVVFENTERLISIIEEIKSAGFGCSMDDFGSGYSSLNLIRSIPVDTIKLDKIFFDEKLSELQRTKAVVESIVTLARALNMETVAEGVEVREQVEMLKEVGCDYVQGYVFAKPMEIECFEKLAFGTERHI